MGYQPMSFLSPPPPRHTPAVLTLPRQIGLDPLPRKRHLLRRGHLLKIRRPIRPHRRRWHGRPAREDFLSRPPFRTPPITRSRRGQLHILLQRPIRLNPDRRKFPVIRPHRLPRRNLPIRNPPQI